VGYSDESKAYRLWKPGTKTVIKARDVKFMEKIGSPQVSSKEILIMSDPVSDIPSEGYQEQQNQEDIENMKIDSSGDDSQAEERVTNTSRRGPGPPKIVKTDK
jgi:hypothetical protein